MKNLGSVVLSSFKWVVRGMLIVSLLVMFSWSVSLAAAPAEELEAVKAKIKEAVKILNDLEARIKVLEKESTPSAGTGGLQEGDKASPVSDKVASGIVDKASPVSDKVATGIVDEASPVSDKAGIGVKASPISGKVATGIVVKGFLFSGNKSIKSADLQPLLIAYIDKSCDLNMLRQASNLVSEEYRRRGLDFAEAYIKGQEIKNGVVEITIVEGTLGTIRVEGNKSYSTKFISRVLSGAAADTVLTSEKLERGLLILNSEFPDLKVTAALEPGKEPGTVDVRVQAEDKFPIHLTLYGNNFGQENVSRYRLGAQIDWTNALIPGAVLTLGGLTGESTDKMTFGNASYLVPLNYLGTKLGLNVSAGRFNVGRDFAELGIYGKEIGGGIFVTHPVIKSRTLNLSTTLGYRQNDAKFYMLDEISSQDKIRVAYADIGGDHVFWGGKSSASFNYTQGLGSIGGGTGRDDPFASRIDASNDFSRFGLNIVRQQPLGSYFSALLRLSGQYALQNLLASEELQLGGVDSVRGYAPGEATGDYGYRASMEVRLAPFEDKEILQLATFVDHGMAYRRQEMIGGKDKMSLTGVGVGVYSRLTPTYNEKVFTTLDFRFDVGWPISPNKNFIEESPMAYFYMSSRF